MDKLGGAGRRAGRKVIHFGKRNGIPTSNGIAGNAASVDTPAYDEKIVNDLAHRSLTDPDIAI
jgi:hypothetical protein